MFDLGMKIRKTDQPNRYKIESICMIDVNDNNKTAEIIGSEEKEEYPIVNDSLDEEVYIIPDQQRLFAIVDDNSLTISEKIEVLNETYEETVLELAPTGEIKYSEDRVAPVDIDNIDIKELSKEVKKSIIGQDKVVDKAISTIIHNQMLINTDLDNDEVRQQKQSMLIFGGTGTGKTEIVKQIAEKINIPYVIEDATKFTEEGYKSRDVSDMLSDLLRACDGDLDLAKRGILIIDEIDKKRASSTETVSTTAVQNSLLKIIEGDIIQINIDSFFEEPIDFDTSFLTVIMTGSFEGMLKNEKRSIGFNSEENSTNNKKYTTEDFVKFGMIPEFMGRITSIAKTNDLEYNDLKKILVESDISPINLKKKFFDTLDVKTDFDEEFLDKIVSEAIAKKTGARGLKSAVADAFDNLEFNLDFEALSGDLEEIKFEKGKVRKKGGKKV